MKGQVNQSSSKSSGQPLFIKPSNTDVEMYSHIDKNKYEHTKAQRAHHIYSNTCMHMLSYVCMFIHKKCTSLCACMPVQTRNHDFKYQPTLIQILYQRYKMVQCHNMFNQHYRPSANNNQYCRPC